jgi:hypothetical protein
MTLFRRKPREVKVSPRTSNFLPGDLVHVEIEDDYFQEFNNRHGVITYGPDDNGGWIVSSAPGDLRCVASELTMITPREERA